MHRPHAWIEHVAQPIAEQIEPEHADDDRNSGGDGDPGRFKDEIAAIGDDRTEGRCRRGRADANKREHRFVQDRDCEDIGEALALTESSAWVPNKTQREQATEQTDRSQGLQVGNRNDLG